MRQFSRISVICALSVFLSILSAAEGKAPAEPRYFGVWQEVNAPEDVVVFEPGRIRLASSAKTPAYCMAAYDQKGNIALCISGQQSNIRVATRGDTITLTGAKAGTYRRLRSLPAWMDLTPLAIPAAGPVAEPRIREIAAEAAKRRKADQAVRSGRDPAAEAMQRTDADNASWAKRVILEVGWPDAARFGSDVALSFFLVIQHSGDIPLMLGVLPLIAADVKSGAVDGQQFAMLFDRTQMYTGRPQRFGSQIVGRPTDGAVLVYVLEDAKTVDQSRSELGLGPLAEYLGTVEATIGKKVGFMERPVIKVR